MKTKFRKNFILKTILISLIIVVVYTGVAFGGVYYYIKANPKPIYDPSKQTMELMTEEEVVKQSEVSDTQVFADVLTAPVRTNFLLVGVDKQESLTDSIMVGSYISTTNQLNLMSIPRDTFVRLNDEQMSKLKSAKKSAPSTMKINAINVYGGKKLGMELLKSKIEEILGIKIDYYAKVNLDAFKSIVDSVGGVYFTVPSGGLYYSDPTQNLYINLKGGYQLLDGNGAEGLVRFRKGYSQQDLQRVNVQREFFKEFIKQALSKENIKENIGTMAVNYLQYVTTDFGVEDVPKYLKCAKTLNELEFNSATLPGYAKMIDGASYYIHDPSETKTIVQEFFYGSTTLDKNTEDAEVTENGSEMSSENVSENQTTQKITQ